MIKKTITAATSISINKGMETADIRKKQFDTEIDIENIVEKIRNGTYKEVIKKVRKASGKKKRAELKKQLPAFTLALSKNLIRESKQLAKSVYFLLDFDSVKNVEEKKMQFVADDTVHIAFISPSGDGLKAAWKLNRVITDPNEFSRLYKIFAEQISKKYEVAVDHTSDCLRLCYYSWDPEIHFNPNSKLIDIGNLEPLPTDPAPAAPKTAAQRSAKRIAVSVPQVSGDSGLTDALHYLSSVKLTYDEWIRIGFFLTQQPNGKDLFIKMSLDNPHFEDTEDEVEKKFNDLEAAFDEEAPAITLGSLFFTAQQYGYKYTNKRLFDDEKQL